MAHEESAYDMNGNKTSTNMVSSSLGKLPLRKPLSRQNASRPKLYVAGTFTFNPSEVGSAKQKPGSSLSGAHSMAKLPTIQTASKRQQIGFS